MKRYLRVLGLGLLQIVVFAIVCGFVLVDDRFIQRGGSRYSHFVLLLGILASVWIAAVSGGSRWRFLLLLLTVPATIYSCAVGFLLAGAAA